MHKKLIRKIKTRLNFVSYKLDRIEGTKRYKQKERKLKHIRSELSRL